MTKSMRLRCQAENWCLHWPSQGSENQDQLATVIGHEVAHVLAEHSNERLSQSQLANAGLSLANVAIGASEYKQYQQLTMAALGVGVQYGVILLMEERKSLKRISLA